jgi:hypothetical protein
VFFVQISQKSESKEYGHNHRHYTKYHTDATIQFREADVAFVG